MLGKKHSKKQTPVKKHTPAKKKRSNVKRKKSGSRKGPTLSRNVLAQRSAARQHHNNWSKANVSQRKKRGPTRKPQMSFK